MQLISDMFGKWDTIYIWELLVLSFKKSSILTIWGFFQLFLAILQMVQVWPENYSSYFGCFHIHAQYLFYRIFSTILYKNINSNCSHFLATSCWPVCCMSWISLNYPTYFTHVQKLMHCLYLRLFTILL